MDSKYCLNMVFSCVLFINNALVIYFASADTHVNKNDVELSYTTEVKDWTRTEESRFQLYYDMSLDDCVIECGLRQHCDLLTYNVHMPLCELFKEGGNGTIQIKQRHWKHVRKQDISVNKTPCGEECNATEACDWKAVSPRCTHKECIDFPTLENGRIFGNIHRIGSKIRYKCNSGWTPNMEPSAVCHANGEWTPNVTCLGCALGEECSSNCCTQSNAECTIDPYYSVNKKTCKCKDAYYQKGDVCEKKIDTGEQCPEKGLHELCMDPDTICELDSPGEKARPKCISKLEVNALCNTARCTEVNNARCESRGTDSKCYCKPGYEFNETLEICVEYCTNYSTNGTTFEKKDQRAISSINFGRTCTLTFDECVEYCNTNHPAYLSINYHIGCHHSGPGSSCVCNKLSLRQYITLDTVLTCTFYDRACGTYP